jgi:NADH dehydrogenase
MDAWLEGPVVVTGAGGHIGRHLLARLAELPNDVRAVDRGDPLEAAFEGAEAAILLAGSLRPPAGESYHDANAEPVCGAVTTARAASVRRIVYLSYVGADPASDNEYLRAKGVGEWCVLRGEGDAVVVRSTYVFGASEDPGLTVEELLVPAGQALLVPGNGRQVVEPVFVGDVVEALVRAALDPAIPRGTYELGGPAPMSFEEFVRTVNARPVMEGHARPFFPYAASHHVPGLTPARVGVLLRDSVARPPLAAQRFGLPELRRLADVWPVPAVAAA